MPVDAIFHHPGISHGAIVGQKGPCFALCRQRPTDHQTQAQAMAGIVSTMLTNRNHSASNHASQG